MRAFMSMLLPQFISFRFQDLAFRYVGHTSNAPKALLRHLHSTSPFESTNELAADNIKPFRIKSQKKRREGTGKPKGFYDDKYTLEKAERSGLPDRLKPFIVLGIESSCDDTGVAVVSSTGEILSNIIYSQYAIHEKFGGIVPSLAMEAHKTNIDKAVFEAIKKAGLSSVQDIDAIAVTKGPGLEICVRVGLRKAQELAKEFNKPFVTVHHLEAHCMTARLAGTVIEPAPSESYLSGSEIECATNSSSLISASITNTTAIPRIQFPFLTLLVSGGHTSLLLCHGLGRYTVLGGTLDDALGEAFDKVARILGLKFSTSGGAAVESEAEKYIKRIEIQITQLHQQSSKTITTSDRSSNFPSTNHNYSNDVEIDTAIKGRIKADFASLKLTLPLRDKANCDFSYAGLKTGFRMAVREARLTHGMDAECTNAPTDNHEAVNNQDIVSLPSEVTSLLCAGFQDMAFLHIQDRLRRALYAVSRLGMTHELHGLVVVGGVAANKELRRRLFQLLDEKYQSDLEIYNIHTAKLVNNPALSVDSKAPVKPRKLPLYFPPISLCTDNGAMVAWAGIEKFNMGISDSIDGQEAIPRWPLGQSLESDTNIFKKL